jgi:hypothetical protein
MRPARSNTQRNSAPKHDADIPSDPSSLRAEGPYTPRATDGKAERSPSNLAGKMVSRMAAAGGANTIAAGRHGSPPSPSAARVSVSGAQRLPFLASLASFATIAASA